MANMDIILICIHRTHTNTHSSGMDVLHFQNIFFAHAIKKVASHIPTEGGNKLVLRFTTYKKTQVSTSARPIIEV